MLPDGTWLMGRARVQFPERAFQAELGQIQFGLRPAHLHRFPAARCLDVDLSLDARLLDDEQGFARRVGEINLALDVDPSFLRPDRVGASEKNEIQVPTFALQTSR